MKRSKALSTRRQRRSFVSTVNSKLGSRSRTCRATKTEHFENALQTRPEEIENAGFSFSRGWKTLAVEKGVDYE